jgi:hypothetical protein
MRGRKQEAPVIAAEPRAVVEAVLHQWILPPRVRERLEMVKARALGQELPTIAQWCGRRVRTVDHWLRQYLRGGVAGAQRTPMRRTGSCWSGRWRAPHGTWGWASMSGPRPVWPATWPNRRGWR